MTGLLQFSARPNAGDTKRSYPIVRCDSEQKYRVAGFILDPQIYGVNVHYVGKSVPCSAPREACTWCDAGRPLRWVGYAAACDLDRHKLFLMEFTPGVMPVFEAYQRQNPSLRGAFVNLTRRKPRSNSRLEATIQPAGRYLAPGDLPAAFDVEEVLERIYGLTAPTEPEKVNPTAARAAADGLTASALARALVDTHEPASGLLLDDEDFEDDAEHDSEIE